MRNINGIYEEKEDEKFRNVPIEDLQNNSIEIYNVYGGIESPKDKCRRKIYNIIIIILIIIIVFMLYRVLQITNLINDDEEPVMNNDFDFNNDEDEDYKKYNEDENEYFYLEQNINKTTFNFSSPQLRKAKNIKLIEKLEISLNLEYDKFVHLKIKDANNKRWEVPEKDILDKEYILNRNDNKIEITKYNDNYDNDNFYLELLTKVSFNEQNDVEDDRVEPDNINNQDMDYNIDIKEEFGFRLMTKDDEEFYSFSTSDNFLFSETYIDFRAKLTSDNIYGFGERIHDFKLNEGTYTIWPNGGGTTKYDDGKGGMNQYSHQPIGLHKTKYNGLWLGFVFLNTNAQDVVIYSGKNDDKKNTYLSHRTIGGIIDYYIIVDDSPEEVIKDINMLLGVPSLPPFWSFGYHQSGQGYNSFNDFKNVYERIKDLEIPLDSMWLDIDSLDNYEMFTINEKFKEIIPYIKSTIHKDKRKFIPIVDIGFSYENKDNKNPYIKLGEELDIFIKSNYTKENLIGKTRAGKVVFPDFFNPNITKFWNKGLDNYYNLVKFDGICLNMNEPTNLLENNKDLKCIGEIVEENACTPEKNLYSNDDLPYIPGYRDSIKESKEELSLKSISENALIYGNNTIYDTKPMISFYQAKYTYDFLSSQLDKNPFILSRSTSIGSGKYSFHWLGDNLRSFDNLKNSISGIFNFNIFGIPFTGSDICGFEEKNSKNSKNMCIRCFHLGIFYPFLRNYNYHWLDQSEALDIIKKNINIRYSLLRYIYSQFFLISLNKKAGFFKPLMLEFPDDEASFEDIESKIMLGESFLLCAFYDNNELSKKFKFPNANFNYYQTGKSLVNYNEEINENKIIELSRKNDEIHLFLRGGFIVPYQNTFDKYILNSQKLREEKINLIINVDNDNQSKGVIYFDNNDNDVIKNNKFYRVDLFLEDKKLSFTTYKNSLEKYNFNDHILGKIEFWRISQLIEINDKNENKTKIVSLKIEYKDNSFSENIEGVYFQENDKVVFDISNGDKIISIFDIDEMELI